jgi:hypothetical protein
MSQDVYSFMIRFIREADVVDNVRWRGLIQHVQGNAEQRFTAFAEAMAFMQQQVNDSVRASFSDVPANPFFEATKLWGEWLPQVNRQLTEQMETLVAQAVKQQTQLPQQMEQAMHTWLAAWGEPSIDPDAEKVAELEKKVAALEAELAQLKSTP